MKKQIIALAATACAVLATGCAHVEFRTSCSKETNNKACNPEIEASAGSLASAFVDLKGMRKYDGKLVDADLFNGQGRWGNIISLDVWPLAGVGIGWLGVSAHILPVEAGVGVFGYNPQKEVPAPAPAKKPEAPVPPSQTGK